MMLSKQEEQYLQFFEWQHENRIEDMIDELWEQRVLGSREDCVHQRDISD